MLYHIYFDGYYQGGTSTLSDAILEIEDCLYRLVSFTMCEPITIIEVKA